VNPTPYLLPPNQLTPQIPSRIAVDLEKTHLQHRLLRLRGSDLHRVDAGPVESALATSTARAAETASPASPPDTTWPFALEGKHQCPVQSRDRPC
jgi:hypothetical protein